MSTEKTITWQPYSTWRTGPNTVTGELLVMPAWPSAELGNSRDVTVLLPPSYHSTQRRYPVLYMQDGQNLFDRAIGFAGQEWQADETMQTLAQEGIEAILVGISNTPQRIQEYNPFPHFWQGRGDDYLRFLLQQIKPEIDRQFRTRPDRAHTGIMGSSMGGLISLYAFFQHPEVFSFAGVMSPSLWVGGGAIYRVVQERPFVGGRLYLDNGTREPSARKMKAALSSKGYVTDHTLKYVAETDGEHNEAAWARRLPDALRFLLPKE
jgi:predicted alpha/beta superfamily hydrolase